MNRVIIALLVACLMVPVAHGAGFGCERLSVAELKELLPYADGCRVDDKVFSNLALVLGEGAPVVDEARIFVDFAGVPGAPVILFDFYPTGGLTVSGNAAYTIEYTVEVLRGGLPVWNVALATASDGTVEVTRELCPGGWSGVECPGGTPLILTAGSAGPGRVQVNLPRATFVGVREAIRFTGGDTGDSATLYWAANVFTEKVPEPATYLLIGSALLGLAVFTKRSRKS